ncbi:hypothetical protein Hanom_Chr16g01511501 [Helianthus anomalus]
MHIHGWNCKLQNKYFKRKVSRKTLKRKNFLSKKTRSSWMVEDLDLQWVLGHSPYVMCFGCEIDEGRGRDGGW